MPTPEARFAWWRNAAFATWTVIGVLILLYVMIRALGYLSAAFTPFVIASLFVFILQSPVSHLEARGVPRGWAVAWWFLIGLVFVWVAALFIIPPIGRQLIEFAAAVPSFIEQGREVLVEAQARFSDVVIPRWLQDSALSVAESLSSLFVRLGNIAAQGIVNAGGELAAVVFNLFLGMVVAFWILKDLPKMREELNTLAGDKYRDDLELLFQTVGRMVGGYIKGQTIASLVTAILAGIGFSLIGLRFAFVLAAITFVFNYVPYVGAFVSGLIAASVGLFVSPITAVLAIIISIVAQNVTDTAVTPRVMSKQVDLHPTLVIFSLLVGGTLLGFWGMIFSIPVAATAKALFVYYWERKTSRQLTSEDGALFRSSSCDDAPEEPCSEDEKSEPDDS